MINVMLAEDHALVRDGISMLLERVEGIHFVGAATNGMEAIELLKGPIKVDVLLTDIQMPELDGISLIGMVKEIHPDIKIIILSMHNNLVFLKESFAHAADGYLLKECSLEEMLFAINHVIHGGKYISTAISLDLAELYAFRADFPEELQNQENEFTEREIEVLQLIGEGLTNHQISEKLFLSKRTVEGHRLSLLQKTNSNNTATLIKYAVLNKLVT